MKPIIDDIYWYWKSVEYSKRKREQIVNSLMYDTAITAESLISFNPKDKDYFKSIEGLLHILSDEGFIFQESSYNNLYDGSYGLLCKYGDKEYECRASVYDANTFKPLIEWILERLREDE